MDTLEQIQSRLKTARLLLEEDSPFSFSRQERVRLSEEGERLLRKLDAVEGSYLMIGLIGGTGVGKSTLMNALAGQEISEASHRRPYTNQILIYRHSEAFPSSGNFSDRLGSIPWREILHQSEPIRSIILCDLPDFDSVIEAHRQHVFRFMEHLDILVWVSSPEKYADGKFYAFLESVPKSNQNFYFVLNKADLLFESEAPAGGHESYERVLRHFQRHIENSGIKKPVLFGVSALEAGKGGNIPSWNQFPFFSREIFQQRDLKTVSAVKAANLDVQVRQYLSVFQEERSDLISFEKILDSALDDLRERKPSWGQSAREAVSLWLERDLGPEMIERQNDVSVLIGSGYGISLLLDRRRFGETKNMRPVSPKDKIPPDLEEFFRRRLEWLESKIIRRISASRLPAEFEKKIEEVLDMRTRMETLNEQFSTELSKQLLQPAFSPSLLFGFCQRIVYAALFAFFFLAVGGEAAWREAIDTPGAMSILQLLVSVTGNLFSSRGFYAVITFILINLYTGFLFYRRFRNRRNRFLQRRLTSMIASLVRVWEVEIEGIDRLLKDLKGKIRQRVQTIDDFK